MYIDIETSAGVRCGDGPIVTAGEFEAVKRLDKAGAIRFPMPSTDERAALVQAKRVARAWKLVNNIVAEIGAGIIDEISVNTDSKGSADLDVSGDDLFRELSYRTVGALEIGTEITPVTTGPASIAAFFPSGWSLDTITGHNATLKSIHHKYEGESCLAALVKLVELTGEHFRLGSGRKVIWMQDDRPDSGVRAIQGGEPVGLESNPNVCLITDLEQTKDTHDCYVGRVYCYGVGDGDARVNLENATNTHAGEGYAISSDGKGWYLEHTTTWNAYGIERYMSFKDVNDATTLAEQAYEWMSRRLTPPESYRLSVTKLDQEIVVGSTIRVVYKRVVDTYVAVDINADLVVLESTTRIDAKGMRTVAFQVATTDAWPDSDTSAIIGGLGEAENSYTHGQPVGGSGITSITVSQISDLLTTTPTILGSAIVDLNDTSKQTIYTVTAGMACIVTAIVVRNASTDLTTAVFGFGWNANADDVVTPAAHTELTGSTLYSVIQAMSGAMRGAAAGVFGIKCTVVQGVAATAEVDVIGYLY
jgi:hypothetical protein